MLGENQDDLSLRECIYGKIKLMDYDGEKRIHSSDFQSAVEQLGLKYVLVPFPHLYLDTPNRPFKISPCVYSPSFSAFGCFPNIPKVF